MVSPATTTDADSPRLTDSPWFWVYLFSTAGFAVLMLMSAKYQHRQTHIEDEYRYGTRTLQRPSEPILSGTAAKTASRGKSDQASSADDNSLDRVPLAAGPQPPTHEMLISLAPLRVLTGIAMVVSCIALQWSYLRRRAKAKAQP